MFFLYDGNEDGCMTKFVVVSRDGHAQKAWHRPKGFQFAAKEPVTPVVLAEIAHVGSWMPIAFMEQAGRYALSWP